MHNVRFCVNWQLASSTLDASAKIYAGRVDAIHTEMYKVLSGLGRGASSSQQPSGDLHTHRLPSPLVWDS